MALHKRSASRRSNDFLAPRVQCFACYDTGIVSNSDGLVWNYVPDYDIDLNTGKRCGGLDLAIVCHCSSATKLAQSWPLSKTTALTNA
jgi:hypothetical protein